MQHVPHFKQSSPRCRWYMVEGLSCKSGPPMMIPRSFLASSRRREAVTRQTFYETILSSDLMFHVVPYQGMQVHAPELPMCFRHGLPTRICDSSTCFSSRFSGARFLR